MLDRNSGPLSPELRFLIWGITTVGISNTSGVRDGFVANSEVVLITHVLTSLVLLLAPLAEEPWLEGESNMETSTSHIAGVCHGSCEDLDVRAES